MKNLLKLNGAKALDKKEQQSIQGGGNFSCAQRRPQICCQTYPSGFVLCEPGQCNQFNGRCFWY